MPISPNRSSACLRSACCSVLRSRSRFSASSSSLLVSSSSSICFRRILATRFSSIRCALDFLFAAASASAFALASAAFLAFSASTSESSAASHESRTCCWHDQTESPSLLEVLTSLSSSSSSNLDLLGMAAAVGGDDGGVLSSSSSIKVVSPQIRIRNTFVHHRICLRLCHIPHLFGGAMAIMFLSPVRFQCCCRELAY